MPAGFTREYHLLVEVAANLSSGFLLLTVREHVAYANPSALRLLQIGKGDLLALEEFDVRKHLLSLVADPKLAGAELDRVWRAFPNPDKGVFGRVK